MIVFYCNCGWQIVVPKASGVSKCNCGYSNGIKFAIFTDEEWSIHGNTVSTLGMKTFVKMNNLEFSVWPSKKIEIITSSRLRNDK